MGQSNGSYGTVRAAAEAGASMVTRPFNAPSRLGNLDPGIVGAALDHGSNWHCLIAWTVPCGLRMGPSRAPI